MINLLDKYLVQEALDSASFYIANTQLVLRLVKTQADVKYQKSIHITNSILKIDNKTMQESYLESIIESFIKYIKDKEYEKTRSENNAAHMIK